MPDFSDTRRFRYALNALLALVSLVAALVLVRFLDWGVGQFAGASTAEIIFPANAEVAYEMMESSSVARTNNLGFRGPHCSPVTTRRRIMFLGDSFTFGWGVNIEDTWVHLAEQQLRQEGLDLELLNLGAPGAGPAQYCAIAERALPILRPELVVVVLHLGDDLWQSEQSAATSIAQKQTPVEGFVEWLAPNLVRISRSGSGYLSPGDFKTQSVNRAWQEQFDRMYARLDAEQKARFERCAPEVRTAFREGKLNPWRMLMFIAPAEFDPAQLNSESPLLRRQEDACAQWLGRLKEIGAAHGAALAVLAIPGADWTDARVWECSRALGRPCDPAELTTTAPDVVAERAARRAGVRYVSATAFLREQSRSKSLYFLYDTHFTREGNAVFASFVAETLKSLPDRTNDAKVR